MFSDQLTPKAPCQALFGWHDTVIALPRPVHASGKAHTCEPLQARGRHRDQLFKSQALEKSSRAFLASLCAGSGKRKLVLRQKPLCLYRRGCPSAGSNDHLPIERILHVPCREHARNIRMLSLISDDVTSFVQL